MKGIKIILTDEQLDYLVKHFKNTDNGYLALTLGISESTLHRFARRFGLTKSKAFMKQMQREAAAAAKYSHLKNGTYPSKGHRIPNSEKYWFKPGRKESAAMKRKRVAKSVETRNETILKERMRIRRGLKQKTKLHLTREPRELQVQRHYLKKQGYTLDETTMTAYWNENTHRATRIEKRENAFYKFEEQH